MIAVHVGGIVLACLLVFSNALSNGFHLDDAYRIMRLDVLIRPYEAIAALRDAIAPEMARYFAEHSAAAGGN